MRKKSHNGWFISTKWITAIICSSAGRMYFVEIKQTLGDFFLAEIEKQIYCFRLTGKVKTFRTTLAKSFKAVIYDTEHYRPVDAENIKALEDLLIKNNLPRMNNRLYGILKHFSKPKRIRVFPVELIR